MTNMEIDPQDYTEVEQWLAKRRNDGHPLTASESAIQNLLNAVPVPESLRRTFADLTEEERRDAIGMAVENKVNKRRGWALEADMDDRIVVLVRPNVFCMNVWFPKDTVLLPDEPRLHIPGVTKEPEPEHPATLKTQADYENAPVGTVVAGPGYSAVTKCHSVVWNRGPTWLTDHEMADTKRQVLRWGWGNE